MAAEDEVRAASVADIVRQTAEDGRAAIEAEINVYKAIIAYRVGGLKVGAPLVVVAVFILQAVLSALFVGLILSLATLVGPVWATLAVTVGGLAIVGLVAWIGVRKLAGLFAPLPESAQP